MRRVVGVLLVLAALAAAWYGLPRLVGGSRPIRVGLLHSKQGPTAVNERSLVEAERLAIEEINRAGGLLGRPVEAVEADGRSDPAVFAREAERLIRDEKVSVIFGCYTSASRKSVKSVVEHADHLLVYPAAYEGIEQSPNIVYTGAAPNQQVIPSVTWCVEVLKVRKFFLVGNDYIWPRAVNAIIKDQLRALGATVVGEEYVPFGSKDLDGAVAAAVAAKPDLILSTLVGDSNLPFYERIRQRRKAEAAGIAVVSLVVAEDELRGLPAADMVNDYSVCSYFQSIDRPENAAFVAAFRKRYGADRTVSDTINTAYNSVRLWAQAVTEAETDDVRLVRTSLTRQSLDAPEGIITVDRETQHTWRPFFVGKVRPDGQFEILWSLGKPIRPVPFPFSRDRERWEKFLDDLYDGWGGNWQAPGPPAGRRAARDWPGSDPVTHFAARGRLSLSRGRTPGALR